MHSIWALVRVSVPPLAWLVMWSHSRRVVVPSAPQWTHWLWSRMRAAAAMVRQVLVLVRLVSP